MSASIGSGTSWPTLRGRWQRIQRDLDETRERVAAEPPRVSSRAVARGRDTCPTRTLSRSLRSGGSLSSSMMLRARRVCALAGRLFLDTAAGGDVPSRPGGSSRVRSRLTIRSCASCSRHGVSLGTSGARKYSSSPRISWLSRCSGSRRPSSGLSRPPRRHSRSSATCPPGRPRTDNQQPFAVGEEPVGEVEEREVMRARRPLRTRV